MFSFRNHIVAFMLLLMASIIPHESWHLLMNHKDTHCEFRHGNSVEAKHQHCEMLAFEISSYDSNPYTIYFTLFAKEFSTHTEHHYNLLTSSYSNIQLRGPPAFLS